MAEKLVNEKLKKGYSESGEVSNSVKTIKTNGEKSSKDEIIEAFDLLINTRNMEGLLPFIKEKTKGNLVEFKKHIKKCKRYWISYIDLSKEPQFKRQNSYNWGYRGDEKQNQIIVLAAIATFDKSEVNAFDEIFIRINDLQKNELVLPILQFSKPNWLEEYLLNYIKKNQWVYIDYYNLRHLESEKLISFNPELYALSLASFSEHNAKNSARRFIDKIANDELAFKRDVPLLFEYETNINNNFFRDNNNQLYNQFKLWEEGIIRLLNENKLNRLSIIEKILQIQTKEWNNGLKSFFKKILIDLKPTDEEVVKFQNTIFPFLHNPYPPIVNFGVELIKPIFEHKSFKINDFMEWAEPLFYRSDCKTAIKNMVILYEKKAKNNPKLAQNLALQMADAFVVQDLALQERIAKTLLKIGDKNNPELCDKISMYSSQMLGNVKTQLNNFLVEEESNDYEIENENYEFAPQEVKKLTQPILLPQTWNDILFQFGQFIGNNENSDIDIVLNVFASQRKLFPEDFSTQVEPYLNKLKNSYFENTSKELMKGFLIEKMIQINSVFKKPNDAYNKINTFKLIIELMKKVNEKIAENSQLPLLSLPTHLHCWIAPKILLERIIAYQEANEKIDITDFTIALSRMPKEQIEEALPLLEKVDSNVKEYFEFAFGIHKNINHETENIFSKIVQSIGGETIKSKNTALWAVLARTFYPNETFEIFKKSLFKDVPFVVKPYKPEFDL